mgnify:CR=1 FL=1
MADALIRFFLCLINRVITDSKSRNKKHEDNILRLMQLFYELCDFFRYCRGVR